MAARRALEILEETAPQRQGERDRAVERLSLLKGQLLEGKI